jgi:hypothetical protein
MYINILRPSYDTPNYYCYEIIYDNPNLSIESINKYYKKINSLEYSSETIDDNIYTYLRSNYIINTGDILYITDTDEYYFYAPCIVKITH